MTCDVSANLISYTPYTIGETGTITDAVYTVFLEGAINEFSQIDPGCSATSACLVKAYLIADYIAAKIGDDAAYKSEKIGDYSYTLSDAITNSGRSKWYIKAMQIITNCYKGVPVNLADYTNGITRNDSEYYDDIYKLDQNIIPDMNNEYS